MEPYLGPLSNVWRIVCQHIDIAISTANIAQLLASHLPMALLLVRYIDKERSSIATVGLGPKSDVTQLLPNRTDCSPANITPLLDWCRRGDVTLRQHDHRLKPELEPAIPLALEGDLLMGPLASAQGTHGLLLLLAHRQHRFTPAHIQMLRSLLEPFAIALENDRRWRLLKTRCRAVEADKRSLLRRLGRESLSQTVIGADGGLRLVMGRVTLVSRSDTPVLLHGESGAGKEVIARAIHSYSSRCVGPFLRIHCGGIQQQEHDAAWFASGSDSVSNVGPNANAWVEQAQGGTLFLDEIGDLPPTSQLKLLRVLQEGVFEPASGGQSIKMDVRIIAATRRDLATMVQRGRFREDLWYRIAAFPIVLPPLREHPEDIPALAAHFAQRAAVRCGLTPQPLSADDLMRLTHYDWPGNVRELSVVIERAVILGDGQGLHIANALGACPNPNDHGHSNPEQAYIPRHAGSMPARLDVAIKQHIEAALSVTRGRVEGPHGAARLLDINPHTLRGRMRKLGINWHAFRATP